MESNS